MKKVCDRASGKKLELMSQAAVMAALTAALTLWLHIPAGLNGGYIHFGDAMIYLAAALLPKPYAMAAGAAGGVIADLLTAPLWAPATLLIKPLLVLPFSSGGERIVTKRNTAALVLAFFLSASGYFLAEGLMFGFHTAFLVSVSGSAVQSGGSALAFLAAGGALDRLQVKRRWRQRLRRKRLWQILCTDTKTRSI